MAGSKSLFPESSSSAVVVLLLFTHEDNHISFISGSRRAAKAATATEADASQKDGRFCCHGLEPLIFPPALGSLGEVIGQDLLLST
jgi:hypothetical protein